MKRIKLLFFSLLITSVAFGQSILGLINKSDQFFDLLDKGKPEEAHAFFDDSIKEKITVDALKNFWTSVTAKLGPLQDVDGAQNRREGELFIVTLNCKFARGNQAFQFAFNASEKLVGFVVVPNSNVASYALPAYADTTLYKEQMMSVKTPGHDLAAILTVPKNKTAYPVVILVHGSGPGDMDETVGPNKPFKDIALGLAARGIATLRYVKRTLVYPNEFTGPITVKEEVLDDALAAIALARTLPAVNKKQIYVLGHSLGGMLAPKIAAMAPDLNGIILAAAPARKLPDMLVEQTIYMQQFVKDTTAKSKENLQAVLKEIDRTRITKLGTMKPDSSIIGLPASYWIDLNLFDQLAAAKKIKQRIMVLQGERDFQVGVTDYNLWKTALAAKKSTVFKLYHEIGHLLGPQADKVGPEAYNTPSNVALPVIEDIAAWIKAAP